MSSTLLQTATGLLTPDLTARASSLLGEPESAVSKALSRGALPLLLAGLASKSQEVGSADRILGLLRDPAYDPRALQNAGNLLGEGGSISGMRQLGERLLALLFGGRLDSVTSALAEFAGIRPSSSSSLLRLTAPLLLGLLGDRAKRDGLDGSSLGRLFGSERDDILRAVPPQLRDALGPVPTTRVTEVVPPGRTGAPRWLWLGLGALGLALLWSLLRGDREEPPRVAAARPAAELPDVAAQRPISWVTRRLPNGTDLRIPNNGIEIRLISLLEGASGGEWVEFDRLLFETDSATLKPESQEQLRNVAVILQAYPNSQVKIGGYTDNTGDPASNLKLSQDRAANVRSSLVNLGVGTDRIEAEGFGEQNPVASNATDEGRARNRRIALRVTPQG